MKSLLLTLAMTFAMTFALTLSVTARAAHAIGDGVPARFNLHAMSIEKPVAGVDFPTDTPMPAARVLVLAEARIFIPAVRVKLETAIAGIDYPTDTYAAWTNVDKVLVLGSGRAAIRIPVIVNASMSGSTISLPSGTEVRMSDILRMERTATEESFNGWVFITLDGRRLM